MTVKTKKYQLNTKTYIKLGMRNMLKQHWWFWFIPAGIIILNIVLNLTVYKNIWIYFMAPLVALLYWLFWAIQFMGVTQLPQNKVMFEKFVYEIDSRFVLMKVNTKEGMQINWNMITKAEKLKDAYLLTMSKAQFIHLPFKIFTSENDIKFVEMILRRKELIKA